MADVAERGLGEGGLFELRSDEAAAVGAFSLDYAGTDSVDPGIFGPSSRASTPVTASTAALVPE